MLETGKPYFTFPETAKEINVSAQTVRRWHLAGLLKAVRPVEGANFRVPRDELKRLMKRSGIESVNA